MSKDHKGDAVRYLSIFWKNADLAHYQYDWGLTGWGWLLIAVMVISVIVWFVRQYNRWSKNNYEEQCKKIRGFGYKDIEDIEVFVDRIGADLDDFINSKGLRKQYEKFAEGLSTDFIKTAESHNKAEEERAEGESSGFTTGYVVGSALHVGM